MTQESVVEKIQKLLEFQHGAEVIDSPEEAANAAEKVQRLLIKHNLSMGDIGGRKEKTKVTRKEYGDITNKKNESTWVFDLYWGLASYNFCRFIITSRFGGFDRKNKVKYFKTGVLIGEEENILAVKFLGEQLEQRLRAMAYKRWKEMQHYVPEKKNTFVRGYLRGAVIGIRDQLKEAQEREMQANVKVTSLVHVKMDAVNKYVEDQYKNLKSSKRSSLSGGNGMHTGYVDGKTMPINKGVESGSRISGKLE